MAVPSIAVNMGMVPKLSEHRFDIWKEKFIMYLFSLDERFPDVLTMGPLIPMMINTRRVPRDEPSGAAGEEDQEDIDEMVPKPRSQWTEEDKSLESLNRRLCFIIGMACNDDTYIHIKGSANAKIMWERLLLYVEGDQRAKDNRLFNCQRAFDSFRKDPKESLRDCYNRYVEVINNCSSLGKDYSPKELNMRFLLCLGNLWHVKVTTIKDTRDLNTLDLASLYADLRVYEDTLLMCQQEDKNFNGLSIALAAHCVTEPSVQPNPTGESEDLMAMFAKKYGFGKFDKYKKFYKDNKSKGQTSTSGNFRKPTDSTRKFHSGKNPDGELVCFNCRKPGHFMSACPQPKYEYFRKKPSFRPRKQKGLVAEQVDRPIAEWADTDEESHSDSEDFTEQANLCLMAYTDDVPLPVCQQPGYMSQTSAATSTDTFKASSSNPSAPIHSKASNKPTVKKCGNSFYGSDPTINSSYQIPDELLSTPTPKPVSTPKRDDHGFSNLSKEELVDLLQELFHDFESLRSLHSTMAKDFHQTSLVKSSLENEVKTLKDDLITLPIMRMEKKVQDEYVDRLKEENTKLSKELRELKATVESYSKSECAVKTLLALQRDADDSTGLGYNSLNDQASTSGTKDHLTSTPISKVTAGSSKFKVVPYSYPKTAIQAKLPAKQARNNNALYGPAKSITPKPSGPKAAVYVVKTPIAQTQLGTPSLTPNPSVPRNKPAVPKAPVVRPPQPMRKSKPPVSTSTTPPIPKPSVAFTNISSEEESVGLIKCDLCCGYDHLVYDCLLRYTPGSKGKNACKVAQVWTPKS